jgi:hypothetical protein
MNDQLKLLARAAALFLVTLTLSGCEVEWVSPYSADLQKRATDMLTDVVAWETHMRGIAGSGAADPRLRFTRPAAVVVTVIPTE